MPGIFGGLCNRVISGYLEENKTSTKFLSTGRGPCKRDRIFFFSFFCASPVSVGTSLRVHQQDKQTKPTTTKWEIGHCIVDGSNFLPFSLIRVNSLQWVNPVSLCQEDVPHHPRVIFWSGPWGQVHRPDGHRPGGQQEVSLCLPSVLVARGRQGWPSSACQVRDFGLLADQSDINPSDLCEI